MQHVSVCFGGVFVSLWEERTHFENGFLSNFSSMTSVFEKVSTVFTSVSVQVYDGKDGAAPLLGTYTGMLMQDLSLTSTSNYLWLEFSSDQEATAAGFRLTYHSKSFHFPGGGPPPVFCFFGGVGVGVVCFKCVNLCQLHVRRLTFHRAAFKRQF